MTAGNEEPQGSQPAIISYVNDLPNMCSLAGLACTILAIYFSILGVYDAAMIGMIWAVAFDWADGLVARKMKGRIDSDRIFGGQLDLVIDIVSYGVAPAVLLLSYGELDPIFLPLAFIMLAAAAIRLSYFSTFGLSDESQYTGLALDNNNIALVFLFLFESAFSHEVFTAVLYVSALGLAALNVSQIKTPKLSGLPRNVYLLAFYTLGVTGLYGSKLL
ncbi:CDP-alcohol phosphatidyltransferase family protein [Luminiphilus sp.]|jgi:CDP-diacylglycerol--serine O-phosphatidyltransferase|nr:CDP-alcohol phosphatidyltransferase family protein [Luminiphilus sp.]